MKESGHINRTILEVGNGIAIELADKEMNSILKNLADPNTDFKKMRKLTLELKFTTDEERTKINVVVACKSSLAPNKPKETTLFNIQKTDPDTGEVYTMLQEAMGVPAGQVSIHGEIHKPQVIQIGRYEA